jgi:hypothetical protein
MAANSNSGLTFGISTTAQNADLANAAAYAALTFTAVGSVGKVGARGIDTNILSYPTLDEVVTQKAKGLTNAGDPEVECANVPADAGQVAMIAAGVPAVKDAYAFEIVVNGETYYNRGIVTGPVRPGGGNEDFDLVMFKLGLVQAEIVA